MSSYSHVHLLDPTAHLLGGSASLPLSQSAARTYALRQAVAERRAQRRSPRPARTPVRERARRLLSRPRPA